MTEKRFKLAYEKGNEAIFEDLAHSYPRRMTNKEVENLLNKQDEKINELKKKNKEWKIKYTNRGIAITKAVEDLYRKEEVYLAGFNICRRIIE